MKPSKIIKKLVTDKLGKKDGEASWSCQVDAIIRYLDAKYEADEKMRERLRKLKLDE